MLRTILQGIGGLLVVMGIFFALQGAGIIMWPAESFMLDQRIWALWGALLAVVGIVLIRIGRR